MPKSHLKKFILSGITTGVIASSSLSAANTANNPQNFQQAPSSAMDARSSSPSQNYSSDANRSAIPSRSGMMDSGSAHRSNNPFENKIEKNQSNRSPSAIKNSYSNKCGADTGTKGGRGSCGATLTNGCGAESGIKRGDRGTCKAQEGIRNGGSCAAIAWEDQSTSSQGKQWNQDNRWDQSQTKPNWNKNGAKTNEGSRGYSTPDSQRTGVERVGQTDTPLAMWGWGEDKKDANSQESHKHDARYRQDATDTRGKDSIKTWPNREAAPHSNGVNTRANGATDGQLALEDDYTPKTPPPRVSNQRTNKIINGHNSCASCGGKGR
jgi:hypothetical protein